MDLAGVLEEEGEEEEEEEEEEGWDEKERGAILGPGGGCGWRGGERVGSAS
jgi:hypothetical protein